MLWEESVAKAATLSTNSQDRSPIAAVLGSMPTRIYDLAERGLAL